MAGLSAHRLLVIDDDALFLEIARHNLNQAGYEVEVTPDPRIGVNRAIESHFDLILLDLMMPGLRGEEVLSLLKPLARQRILVISGNTGDSHRSRARDLGAVAYLQKPISAKTLCDTVAEILVETPTDATGDTAGSGDRATDIPVCWVFGVGPLTTQMRIAAWLVLLALMGIFLWLVGS